MTQTVQPPVAEPRSAHRGLRAFSHFAATTAAAAAGLAVLAAVDPNEPGHYPTCPFLFLSGHWCPGCGTLRAVHDLLHLDPAGAFARNPLAVLLIPYVLFAWGSWGLRTLGYDAPHPTRIRPAVIWSFLVVVLLYWVLRNVPGWTWLSPA